MLNLIRNLRSPPKLSQSMIVERFFNHPEHQWFAKDPILSRLMRLYCESWNQSVIDFMAQGNEVLILKGEGHLACAMAPVRNANVILAFPDLVNILRSASPIRGLAILAHEMGHLILEHSKRTIGNLEAQVEADEFAFRLGYGRELEQVLLEHEHSIDCRVRIARLTQLYYATKK